MDELDTLLLRRLERRGRIAMVQLGEEVGLSASAVQRRVRSLEADGTIVGYRVAVRDLAAYEELWSTRLSAMRGAVRVASQMTMKVVKR